MKWLGKEIILDTLSIDFAALIFTILSLFFCIITILIFLRVKSLRTIIYRLFFHVAIQETISRCAHIIEFFNIQIKNNFIFNVCTVIIYFTDTNILIFVTFFCYSMYELILKQNKKINNQFNKYLYGIFAASAILTTIFFAIPVDDHNKEIYRKIIALNFIKDTEREEGKQLATILMTLIIYFLLIIYSTVKVVQIQLFIRKSGNLNDGEEDRTGEKKNQKSLKLKSFKFKMYQYPILGYYYFVPLCVYCFIEYSIDKDSTNLRFLRARYIFYNIYCFLNSIRAWMFFKVFISNEKLKMLLFSKYLTSSVFYTIDKIYLPRERNSSINSISSYQSIDGVLSIEGGDKKELPLGITEKKINNVDNEDDDDEKEKLPLELDIKDRSFEEYNDNNLDDDDDNEIRPINIIDSKSESLKPIRKNK